MMESMLGGQRGGMSFFLKRGGRGGGAEGRGGGLEVVGYAFDAFFEKGDVEV